MSHTHVAVRASRRARLVLAAVLVPAFLATLVAGAWLHAGGQEQPHLPTMAPGSSIVEVEVTDVDPSSSSLTQVSGRVADGSVVDVHAPPEYLEVIAPEDRIRVMALTFDEALGGDGSGSTYVFMDFVRAPPMLLLAAVMTVLVVAVARLRGFAALVGLGLALVGLAWFTLPALIAGRPAMPVSLVTAVGLLFIVLYVAHGISARTSTALAGTLVGVVLTAGIGAWATGAAHLTGLGGELSLDLVNLAPQMSLRGVLLCGLVLAGIGVLNDVTITQASAVWELRAASPGASRRDVFAGGMRIGRDHIASTVYTIAFAYVGASLPLVLILSMSDRALLDVLTAGEIAEEVVRTLVGSIGLVLAIPVTTAIGALVAGPRSLSPAGLPSDDGEPRAVVG